MAANPSKSEIVFKLYSRLKQSPCTIAILEDWKRKNGYIFSSRSLYRYLNELADNIKINGESIEIHIGENNKKTWKLVFNSSANDFSLTDIQTFYLSKIFIPKDILQQRRKSFQILESAIYQKGSKGKFEFAPDTFNLKFQNSSFYEARYTSIQQKTIDQLIWAIQNKRKLVILSLSDHVDVGFNQINIGDIVLPLTLQQHRGVLNLCAFNQNYKKIVVIAFDTLASFEATNDIFNPQKYAAILNKFFNTHFGISQNIDDKIYKIELEFAESVGGFVTQFFWHNTQQFKLMKNGNTLLTLNCGINRELVGWIFQWMNNVKVKRPLLLKNMVVEIHEQCINGEASENLKYYNNFLRKGV